MNWSDKRVFVTGATGLVGSWLVRRLVEEGAQVVALMHDTDPQSDLVRSGTLRHVSVVNGALEDYATLERAINEHAVDTVFHLGAQAIVGVADRSPLSTFETNVRGTYNLMEACRVHSNLVRRVLVASSDKAYGPSDTLPYTEDLPPLGHAPYEVSKSCTDLICQSYGRFYKLPIVIARCGNIYGGCDLNWSRVVPGTIRSLLRGEKPIIRSDGKFLRDYVYVDDAVDAYLLMAANADHDDVLGEAFNFGPDNPTSVVDIVRGIAEVMERTDLEPVILNQAQGEIRDQYLDSSKAKRVLGWGPKYDLEEGLRLTVDWYREFLESPVLVS